MSGEVSKAVFNSAVDRTLAECQGISNQRGGEYLDSWALENQCTAYFDHVWNLIWKYELGLADKGVPLTAQAKRLLIMASLCDVKISRLLGPYKRDTFIDHINYEAALADLIEQYIEWNRNEQTLRDASLKIHKQLQTTYDGDHPNGW